MVTNVFKIPSFFEVRFIDKPSGCERPHTHSSIILSAVSKGYVSLQINAKETRIEKDMLTVIGPNMLHCVRYYSHNFKGIYVLENFDPFPLCNNFKSFNFTTLNDQLQYAPQIHNSFIDLCQKLFSYLNNKQKIELYSKWVNEFFNAHYSSRTAEFSKNRGLAVKIRKILDQHKGNTPPFDEISGFCGLCKERCNRIFRQAYNISIQGYFLNEKAGRARALLTLDQTLSDIALECGFYDQSHFNRIFKEIFQISPAKYRALIGETCQSHTRNNR